MIKVLILLSLYLQLIASDSNSTTEIITLEEDSLFHAKRESGLSVHEALNRAIELSPSMKAAYHVVVQDKQKVQEAWAGHLPAVNISGDLGFETRQFAGDVSSEKFKTPIEQSTTYKKTDLYMTISENLYSGGSVENSIDEKEANLNASLYDYRDKLEKIVVDVTTAYFNVVYDEIALKISLKNMQNYKKILNIVSIKEKNGAATKGDVNFIKANVDNAMTELIQKQKKLSDSLAKYVYLVQTQEDDKLPFEISTELMYAQDLNTSLFQADEKNAKILKQKAYIKATAFALLGTKGDFSPKINLAINAETRDEYDIGLGKREKVNALVTFSYNLYNGGKDEAKAIRYLAKIEEQKYIYQDLKRNIAFDIKVLHNSVTSLSNSLQLTQSEVLAARKVVKSYWLSFQNGTQDLQALQLAQRNLNRAEQDYASYKKGFIINNFVIMRKTGTLLKNLSLSYKKNSDDFQAKKLHLLHSYEDLK